MSIEYRDITGFPGYRVGNDGSVWSRRIGGTISKIGTKWKRLRPRPAGHGYRTVMLNDRRDYYIHRLVLIAFSGPCPIEMEGCHNNGVKSDNRLENLRWDTRKGNSHDKVKHGTENTGERNGGAKLTRNQVNSIRLEFSIDRIPQHELARRYLVHVETIGRICRGKLWSKTP